MTKFSVENKILSGVEVKKSSDNIISAIFLNAKKIIYIPHKLETV